MTVLKHMHVWVVLAVMLSGCSTISVSTDYDTSRDFAALKTFAWMQPKSKLVVDPLVDNDLMIKRIQRSVETELNRRGYVKATGDTGADFLVTYHVSAEDKVKVDTFHTNFGYYPCWHRGCMGYGFGYQPDVQVRQYKQGTFMLDIVDPVSEQLMWRGVAGKRLSSGTPSQRDQYVQEIVAAILAKFPPGMATK